MSRISSLPSKAFPLCAIWCQVKAESNMLWSYGVHETARQEEHSPTHSIPIYQKCAVPRYFQLFSTKKLEADSATDTVQTTFSCLLDSAENYIHGKVCTVISIYLECRPFASTGFKFLTLIVNLAKSNFPDAVQLFYLNNLFFEEIEYSLCIWCQRNDLPTNHIFVLHCSKPCWHKS